MIKLNNVSKVFDHRGIAGIHQLSLEIPKGKIFCLMGPNGSGKTTLLNLMLGKITLDYGEIRTEGKIHFFQNRESDPNENVQKFLIRSITSQMDEEKKIQLSRDMADIFEFTFQLRQNMGQLSQGQRQKVLMASELINACDILFLDEPFIHLDPMSREEILGSLFDYIRQREVTVVWVTHEKDEALKFADLIGLIQYGKIEQVSPPIEMLKSPKNLFVAKYFGHQNFIKITGLNGHWKTPWGEINHPLKAQEGYLVIPPDAWKIDHHSPFEGVVLQHYPKYYKLELVLEAQGKRFIVCLPLTESKNIKNGQKLPLSPDLNHCFILQM